MKENNIRILYIDDEVNNLNAFKAVFRRYYEIYTSDNTLKARDILKNVRIHVIIADQKMPGTTGIEFFNIIKEIYPDTIRILLTGYADIKAAIDAINKGHIFRYVSKPWDDYDLHNTINSAYQLYITKKETETRVKEMEKTNDEISEIYKIASQVFRSPLLSALGIIKLSRADSLFSDPNGYLKLIEKQILQVDKYIRLITEYHKNIQSFNSHEKIYFESLMLDCLEGCEAQESNIDFQLSVNQITIFYSNSYRISMVLKHIISNIIRYRSEDKENISITISTQVDEINAVVKFIYEEGCLKNDQFLRILNYSEYRNINIPASEAESYIIRQALSRIDGQLIYPPDTKDETNTAFTITIHNKQEI